MIKLHLADKSTGLNVVERFFLLQKALFELIDTGYLWSDYPTLINDYQGYTGMEGATVSMGDLAVPGCLDGTGRCGYFSWRCLSSALRPHSSSSSFCRFN